jgi:hypothetical protein
MSLPVTVFEDTPISESETIQKLYQEILDLRETNRVVLDVFRSASGLVRNCCEGTTCDKETVCLMLSQLVQSLEVKLKESVNARKKSFL